ncbi:MAG TPA: hypothetical protein VIV20_07775 [Gammaproteobacteria bacterium]
MKVIFLIIVLAAAVGAWLYFNPDVQQELLKETPLATEPTTTHLYKWRDVNGQWQVSDKPPTGNVEYEVMQYRSDTNVVPGLTEEELEKD